MRKLVSVCMILCSFVGFTTAQNDDNNRVGFINYTHPERLYRGRVGHPYLFTRWQTGELIWNKKTLKNVAFKYNIHLDQLMFMRIANLDSIMLERESVDKFVFYSQDNRKFLKYSVGGKTQFLEVVYEEGAIQLLKKWSKVFIQADSDITYNGNNFYDEYRLKTTLYFSFDGKVYRLKNKNNLLKVMDAAKAREAKRYIQKKQLFLKEEKDVVELFQYLDSL